MNRRPLTEYVKKYNKWSKTFYSRHPTLEVCEPDIKAAFEILINSFSKGGKLLTMGNGGSSADAEHICGELVKGFVLPRTLTSTEKESLSHIDSTLGDNLQNGLPAFSLGVSHSLISAFANDMDPNYIFAQQVWVHGAQNDSVLGISTSGNSKNVIEGFKVARAKGIPTIALTGESESLSSELATVTIKAPSKVTHEVQEYHLPIYHHLCLLVEDFFFGEW